MGMIQQKPCGLRVVTQFLFLQIKQSTKLKQTLSYKIKSFRNVAAGLDNFQCHAMNKRERSVFLIRNNTKSGQRQTPD